VTFQVSDNTKIGFIGNGFVGNATSKIFEGFKTVTWDIVPEKCSIIEYEDGISRIAELRDIAQCDFIFIAVPTPMKENGSISTTILAKAILNITNECDQAGTRPFFIIKSTVIPGTTKSFASALEHHTFIFNPEFLVEKTAIKNALAPDRIVLGGTASACANVWKLYKKAAKINRKFRYHDEVPLVFCDTTTAEFIKYMSNCFFATKVSFMNEMHEAAKVLNVDWHDAQAGILADNRFGRSHYKVPGPDGHHGFGGKCFPKDLNAFKFLLESEGMNPLLLNAAWDANCKYRDVEDWYNIDGATEKG